MPQKTCFHKDPTTKVVINGREVAIHHPKGLSLNLGEFLPKHAHILAATPLPQEAEVHGHFNVDEANSRATLQLHRTAKVRGKEQQRHVGKTIRLPLTDSELQLAIS
jgi:hypothetical protein